MNQTKPQTDAELLAQALRELDALRVENERLRAALEWVRDDTELWDAPIVLEALKQLREKRDHAIDAEKIALLKIGEENKRLRAMLRSVAACSENDDVPFGDHLCIEQVRVEVGSDKAR